MKGIVECGFEHPSEVQHACIPQALLGTDILCQAKSGMGKTAVFVLCCLQTVDISTPGIKALIIAHTRELAFQIAHEFKRLGKHISGLKVGTVFGGTAIAQDKTMLEKEPPHVLVGTPGRVHTLLKEKALKVETLSHFILDECDRCLDELDMRKEIQRIFI